MTEVLDKMSTRIAAGEDDLSCLVTFGYNLYKIINLLHTVKSRGE